MGTFSWSVTLMGVRADAVAAELEASRQPAWLYAEGRHVVVFPLLGDESELAAVAASLAARLRVPALAALVADSDVLRLAAFDAFGALRDTYDNAPGYFDDADAEGLPLGGDGVVLPVGGDAALLVALAGAGDEAAVEATLRREWESYTFAEELHEELVRELGLPLAAVGTDVDDLLAGELPPGAGEWRHVAAA